MIAAATGVAAAAISVSPVRIRLAGAAAGTITLANAGNAAATVDASSAGLAVDRRGRPLVAARRGPAAAWLRLRPARLVLAPGRAVTVAISAVPAAGAAPGDHAAVVLFTTRPAPAAGVAVRLRVGVVVVVRVAGPIVHRLELRRVHVRRRVLEATVANRGNVVERTRVRVTVTRGGHVLARLRSAGRTLLPHSSDTERFRRPTRLHGWVRVRIDAGTIRRTLRIRL